MYLLSKLLHLAGAIFWLGGMGFVLLALRPALAQQLEAPAQRLGLLTAVLSRFFAVVWISIGVLLLTGGHMLRQAGVPTVPTGWHLMAGLGTLMALIFGHLYFAPYRRLRLCVANADWPQAARQAQQIALLVRINFGLGWLAVAALVLVH